jgi:hypothetical protein
MSDLARLVQANKYLNKYPIAGIAADVLSKFGRISSGTSRHIVMPFHPRKADNVGIV